MTEGLAIEIAAHKMRERGIGQNYLVRFRHFQIENGGQKVLKGTNDLYILLMPDIEARISSKNGIYDMKDSTINEMQYLHTGDIIIVNQSLINPLSIKFLQVVPIH